MTGRLAVWRLWGGVGALAVFFAVPKTGLLDEAPPPRDGNRRCLVDDAAAASRPRVVTPREGVERVAGFTACFDVGLRLVTLESSQAGLVSTASLRPSNAAAGTDENLVKERRANLLGAEGERVGGGWPAILAPRVT